MAKPRIDIPKEEIAEFCRRNHIHRLALFGSVLRDDFTSESDVDVLVEFEPDARVGLLGLARMEIELGARYWAGRWTSTHRGSCPTTSGMRCSRERRHNMTQHDYDKVDLDVLWDTIEYDLPPLIAELRRILDL